MTIAFDTLTTDEQKFISQFELTKPMWPGTANNAWGQLLHLVWQEISTNLLRYGRFRGNKIAYLRHLGTRIGRNCHIQNPVNNFGTEPWLIEIGNRVTLARGVVILTHDGANRLFRNTIAGSSPWGNRFGTVRIGDNCFIGANAVIMPGVNIGADSIVGVGSVVNKDVPPGTVVAGVPAKPICTLSDYIARYQQKMVPIRSTSRQELRQELTQLFWGEIR